MGAVDSRVWEGKACPSTRWQSLQGGPLRTRGDLLVARAMEQGLRTLVVFTCTAVMLYSLCPLQVSMSPHHHQHFIITIFKHTATMKYFHGEHSYSHHCILLLFYQLLSAQAQPSLRHSIVPYNWFLSGREGFESRLSQW